MTSFNVYDEIQQRIIQYRRVGECNQCGECCKRLIYVYTTHPSLVQLDKITTSDRESISLPTESRYSEPLDNNPERRTWIFQVKDNMPEACPELIEGRCRIHGTRPVCSVFPTQPSDIENLPDCSYSFEVIEEWEM